MTNHTEELSKIAPVTQAETALLRIPRGERLPKISTSKFKAGADCSDEVKDIIRKNGWPKT